jgi:cytochrome bd ubiquinol oxidase subunit I
VEAEPQGPVDDPVDACCCRPGQLLVGDIHGLNTFKHQPTKVAAMEGAWETGPTPLMLFAIPDQANETNRFEIGIPYAASLILTHELDGEVPGLKTIPAEERPPVAIVFWSFRIMVTIGLLMIASRWPGAVAASRRALLRAPPVSAWAELDDPGPLPRGAGSGWFVTEIGRAPWLIYEVMTHAEGVTPAHRRMALFTLLGYGAVYAVVFAAGMYYLIRIVRRGPEDLPPDTEPHAGTVANVHAHT